MGLDVLKCKTVDGVLKELINESRRRGRDKCVRLALGENSKNMSTETQYPYLTIETDGTAQIGSTRYKVIHLAAEHYHHGWTGEELLRQNPDLKPDQVYAALVYFYDHYEDLVRQMQASAEEAEVMQRAQVLSRDELLKRRAAGSL